MDEAICYPITRRARKDYSCEACAELLEIGLSACIPLASKEEKEAIEKARLNDWKIKKGDNYTDSVWKGDGGIYHFRVIPAIDAFMGRNKLYGYQN